MKSIKNMSAQTLKEVVLLASVRNFTRKRSDNTRLEVAESIMCDLKLEGEPMHLVDIIKAEIEAQKAEPAKQAAEHQPPVMTGSSVANDSVMQVLESDCTRPVIVTSAQNNTKPEMAFYQLKALAENMGALLVVLPVYYNKSAFSASVESEDENFHADVRPYLVEQDSWLFSRGGVRLAAQAAVLPTAKLPVNAAADLNAGEPVTVVASPKQQMQSLPVLASQSCRTAWSTGTVTGFNYVRGRAGSTAEKSHKFGGLLLYVDDNNQVQITNLVQGDNGTFISWLNDCSQFVNVSPDNEIVYSDDSPNAIKLGDLHCEVYDPTQWNIALDLVQRLQPEFVAVDDILHFSTRSHHNRKDSLHLYSTRNESVEGDLSQVITQLNQLAVVCNSVYVTESNHNSALDCWISDSGVKISSDSHNAKLYHLINWLVMDTLDTKESGETALALEVALKNSDLTTLESLKGNIEFGRMDVQQVGFKHDFSQHGHKGQNGSKATPRLLEKWNLPLVTGHTHSPSIYGDVFTTGVTASKQQGYNRGGASSWMHAHVIEHVNGTCQMLITDVLPLV